MPKGSVEKMFSAMVANMVPKGKATTGKPSKKRKVPAARGRPAWQQA